MGKTPENVLENSRRWRERNREKVLAYNKTYYAANAEKLRETARERKAADPDRKTKDGRYYREIKREYRRKAIDHLGGKCVRCGFSDWRGLQIDHVENGGSRHRKSFKNIWSYYKDILANLDSGKYQILCANCNQIKRYESGSE